MASFYEISKSVRITNADPIDGDRYIAADLDKRDSLVTPTIGIVRAYLGVQVYTVDARTSAEEIAGDPVYPKLFILTQITPSIVWDTLPIIPDGGEMGKSNFIELLDTPMNWPAIDGTNYVVEVDFSGGLGNEVLNFTPTKDAYNKKFGLLNSMSSDPQPDGGDNNPGIVDEVSRIDHVHNGLYYTKTEIIQKLDAVSAGIKYIWEDLPEMDSKRPTGGYLDAEQGLLKTTVGVTTGESTCDLSAWTEMGVYQYSLTTTCWTLLYTLGGGSITVPTANEVKMHTSSANDFVVTADLGGFKAGNDIFYTDDVYAILRKLLETALDPSLSPSAAITVSETIPTSGVMEVGSDLSGGGGTVGFSGALTQGTIHGWDSSSTAITPDQVGVLNPGVYTSTKGFGGTLSNVTGLAEFGSNTAKGSYTTTAGSVPVYDSNGTIYTSISRTVSNSKTVTVTGGYYRVVGFFTTAEKDTVVNNATASTLLLSAPNRKIYTGGAVTDEIITLNASKDWIVVLISGHYNYDTVVNGDTSLLDILVYSASGDVITNADAGAAKPTYVEYVNLKDAAGTTSEYTLVTREMGFITNPEQGELTIR